ncbi:hypothetical protein [Embleya scabrispora]|uniref:hypothetical protein n=1 Tax=Embleya scabrispora TaxID=159449 RepID=UPI00117D6A24|nr:hypothetical protein [Embleya scabrispora]
MRIVAPRCGVDSRLPDTEAGNPVADEAELHRDALQLFLTTFSPRTTVRVADRCGASGSWLNAYGSTVPLSAVDAERPVAMHLRGRTEPRIWPFDFDARSGPVGAQVAWLTSVAAECGVRVVQVASGPTGGRHLWMGCPDGLPNTLLERLTNVGWALSGPDGILSALDVAPWLNLRQGAMRPPGSPHRLGGFAELLHHAPAEAVGILEAGSSRSDIAELVQALEAVARRSGARRRLPRGARAAGLPPSVAAAPSRRPVSVDEQGHLHLGRDRRDVSAAGRLLLATSLRPSTDHSAHAFATLLTLALGGLRHRDVAMLVKDGESSPGLEYFRSARHVGNTRVPRADGEKVLARQWRLAVERASRLPPRTGDAQIPDDTALVVHDLLLRLEKADPHRWTRPSGPADFAVLNAVALVCLTVGKREVALDVRRLALLTGRSHDTAARAVRRLVADGWLGVVARADAERYRARVLTIAQTHVCPTNRQHVCAVPPVAGSDTPENTPHIRRTLRTTVDLLGAPIWEVLGHHAARTYQALRAGTSCMAALVHVTGYTRRTLVKHLRRLKAEGLVRVRGMSWKARSLANATRPRWPRACGRELRFLLDRARLRWWNEELSAIRNSLPEAKVGRHANRAVRPFPRHEDRRPDHGAAIAVVASHLDIVGLRRQIVAAARAAGHSVLRHLPGVPGPRDATVLAPVAAIRRGEGCGSR